MKLHAAPLKHLSNKVGNACRLVARKTMQAAPGLFFHLRNSSAALWNRILTLPVSKKSLRLRLSLFFSLFMLTAWLAAAAFSWHTCREYINEFFDSQQMLVARTLAVSDVTRAHGELPRINDLLPGVKKHAFGQLESEAIAIAIFSPDGRKILSDEKKGRHFPFEPSVRGFVNEPLHNDDDIWRILWMNSSDGRFVIAVGQELDYRSDMAVEMLESQLLPWLILLPVLLVGLFIILTRELSPMRSIAAVLRSRTPEDTAPLDLGRLPSEVLPMAESLNGFFARTQDMLNRERSFISDAAHELRTPLAGLRIQAQVAAQPGIERKIQLEALSFLRQGIDRCSRLIDQILALSRLEASHGQDRAWTQKEFAPMDWTLLLEEFLPAYRPRLESAGIRLESQITSLSSRVNGNPTLLSMLLRNVLENAAAYTPEGGLIRITLNHDRLIVQNDCHNLPDEYMSRLGERFFRPPGQEKTGSGLGISIVRRIAAIHGFPLTIQLEKHAPGFSSSSFKVSLAWNVA